MNAYRYAGNDPVNQWDPLGLLEVGTGGRGESNPIMAAPQSVLDMAGKGSGIIECLVTISQTWFNWGWGPYNITIERCSWLGGPNEEVTSEEYTDPCDNPDLSRWDDDAFVTRWLEDWGYDRLFGDQQNRVGEFDGFYDSDNNPLSGARYWPPNDAGDILIRTFQSGSGLVPDGWAIHWHAHYSFDVLSGYDQLFFMQQGGAEHAFYVFMEDGRVYRFRDGVLDCLNNIPGWH